MAQLDAVVPLISRDLERFSTMARSLSRFFPELGRLFVVVPDEDHATLFPQVRHRADALNVQVVPESAWVPEMKAFFHLPGWYRQQLVKLAAAEFVSTSYYLTLDADVVCTRPTTAAQLLPGGKAACFVIPHDYHPRWYEGAEAALDLRAPRRGVVHNVTPVVWSREAVLGLLAHLDGVARRTAYSRGWRGLQQRLFFTLHRLGPHRRNRPWRAWLAASRPWAEYAMYFTLLEATGTFDRYHFASDYCIYDIERSVWKHGNLDTWDPRPVFEGNGPPFFVVIQSNTGVAPARVWQKLSPWLGGGSEAEGSA